MMEALRRTRPLKKPKERRGLAEAMQTFLDDELPAMEKAARERRDAEVAIQLTLGAERLDDPCRQAGLAPDLAPELAPDLAPLLPPTSPPTSPSISPPTSTPISTPISPPSGARPSLRTSRTGSASASSARRG